MNLREQKGPIKEQKGPRKPLIYYYLVAMLVLMLLNWLVMPWFREHPYSRWITAPFCSN